MSIRSEFPDLPPLWGVGLIVLQGIVSVVVPLVRFGDWSRPAGWALVGTGFAIVAWAALWFLRKRTPIEPGERPRALIVEGPYRLNRNPIYTGMATVVFGFAFVFASLSAILVAIVFPLIIDRRFVGREEAALRDAFGPDADAYFARTRRW